jgi:hypothetical protein
MAKVQELTYRQRIEAAAEVLYEYLEYRPRASELADEALAAAGVPELVAELAEAQTAARAFAKVLKDHENVTMPYDYGREYFPFAEVLARFPGYA